MKDTFLKIYSAYGKAQTAFAMAAGLCTFFIMILIVVNALTRKFLNMPINGATEFTSALLVAVIMLPFAYTQIRREHVSTVVLTQRLPHDVRRMLHIFWLVVGGLLFLAVTYGAWTYALRSWRVNEQVWAGLMQFPIWPAKMSVCVGTLLLAIQFLLDAAHAILIDDERAIDEQSLESVGHV